MTARKRTARERTTSSSALVSCLVLVALVVAVGPASAQPAAEPGAEPAWVQEKEDAARALVRQASAERQSYLDAGETGPRAFQATFQQAADLLQDIVVVAPTARRLYGLAFARFHSGSAERAHFACDRVSRDFPDAADVVQRCEALTAMLHGEVYRVLVDSVPQGASVTVDGWPEEEAARTPGVLWLRAGARTLAFRLDGYVTQTQAVKVEPGFVTQVKAQLQTVPTLGRVELVIQPPDAKVLVDGSPLVVPLNGIVELPLGVHTIRVEADGYVARDDRLTVTAEGMTSQWYELEAEPSDEPDVPDQPYWEQPAEKKGPRMTTMEILGWVGVGVGGAAVAGGAVMHGLAAAKAGEASDVPNLPGRRADFESRRDEARTFETTAYALYGAGAAILTGGILLVVLDPGPTGDGEGTTVAPTAMRDGFGVAFTTRF